jgi:hypothetical protein
MGYIRAAAQQNLKEMQALVPQIESRLAELGELRVRAEEEYDDKEQRRIDEETADLKGALRLIRHHERETI